MQLFHWTTADVPERFGFAYWQDAVSRAVFNVSTDRPYGDHFHARINARRTDTLSYVSFQSSSHAVTRDEREAKKTSEPSYLVSLQLTGIAEISQGGAHVKLTPGNLCVVASWRPFSVRFTGSVERILVIVPRRLLISRIDGLRMIPGSVPFADLLIYYFRRLSNPAVEVSDIAAQTLGQNVCNLIDITCGLPMLGEALPEVKRDLLLHFMRQNLKDPALSPSRAAAHLGVSLRSVHHLLKPTGETFGAWVLERRLQACAQDLQDRRMRDCRVADIAYRWGFTDLSHFNHAFKARFGITPGEMKAISE